ncbi:MAG TPA: 3-phosphoserine/phosphohydroxythreonine transaminase [Planctomycetes bacterium]|nr:3-phosphoserine/phosphohydroxythreonine transaminase [Planctomycetota bacterium]
MTTRVYNFNPGPAALPLSAIEKARDELLSFRGTGMSIMEVSHRSAEFGALLKETDAGLRGLLAIPDDYAILYLGGGASLQFSMAPINLLGPGQTADYVETGEWSSKAIKEARKVGRVNVAASTKEEKFRRIPRPEELKLTPGAAYVHITSNNTIFGTQWQRFPDAGSVPLVADMSSDILSRPFDVKPFGLIYAGAQKNLGPAGVTVVIVRRDLVGKAPENTPTMLNYKTHLDGNSLFNTPPCFAIYMIKLVLDWVQEQGGLAAVAARNEKKARLLYDAIDNSNGFYRGTCDKDSRSRMNVTFVLGREELSEAFAKESSAASLKGLKGHRSVGGFRASIYNAVGMDAVEALVAMMEKFRKRNS